jgi:N-acetylneuraminic acid mutarotase
MAVQHNAVYLLGGRRKNTSGISDIFNTVFRFDLKTQQWSAQKPLPYAVSAGTGLAVGDRDILLFSGDKGATFHRSEELDIAIAKEKDTQKKQALLREKAALMTAHPGFTKDVLLYNTATGHCTKINPLSYEGQATTSAFTWNGHIIIPSGEIKAGVRTPVVMSGKIYFN